MATTENSGRLSVPFVTPGELYAASIVFPFLGIVFTPLRFYAKTLQKNSIGLDDWLMLPTLVCGPRVVPERPPISDRRIDSSHRNGSMSAHRFVVDIVSKAISLTHRPGVNTKAIGYSLPLIENLEQFTNGIPIAQLFGKV